MFDISAKITNQLPVVKITDELIVTVNNRHKTVINVTAKVKEAQRKATKEGEGSLDEDKLMSDVLVMIIGEKNAKAIDNMDLPITEHKLIYNTILNVAVGITQEETPRK